MLSPYSTIRLINCVLTPLASYGCATLRDRDHYQFLFESLHSLLALDRFGHHCSRQSTIRFLFTHHVVRQQATTWVGGSVNDRSR